MGLDAIIAFLAGACAVGLPSWLTVRYITGTLKADRVFWMGKADEYQKELMFLVKHIRSGKAEVIPEDEEWGSYTITDELELEREGERSRAHEPLEALPPLVIPS
jgi:hypothetical protein